MAWFAREKTASRPLAIPGRVDAEAHATPRLTRASARNRSNRSLVKNRRRLHRRALCTGGVARGNPLRPGPSTRIALRTRTNLQDRNPSKTETTLWRQNHSGPPFPCWLRQLVASRATSEGKRRILFARRGGL